MASKFLLKALMNLIGQVARRRNTRRGCRRDRRVRRRRTGLRSGILGKYANGQRNQTNGNDERVFHSDPLKVRCGPAPIWIQKQSVFRYSDERSTSDVPPLALRVLLSLSERI